MLSLRELQLSFANALFEGSGGATATWIRSDGLDPIARLDIYRNNLQQAFLKALALGFPVVQRLVGEDYFRQLGAAFQQQYPSRAGDLQQIGSPFPAFLREQFANTPYAYLPDVAALEWAYQESLIAADATALDLGVLQAVPPEQLQHLRFELQPACKLVSSQFPIVRIWRANQDDRDGTEAIDLNEGPDFVLVRRADDGAELRRLTPADFAFLRSLSRGASLGDSLQAGQMAADDFDLAAALRQCVGLGMLVAVHST